MKLPLLRDNLFEKFFAFLFAFGLWVYIVSGQSKAMIFPGAVPINLNGVSPELSAITDASDVRIKIVAEPDVLNRLSAENFRASVELGNIGEGTYQLEVNVSSNIAGVRIVERSPAKIAVRVEPSVKKEVMIKVKTSGEPKKGFAVADASSQPDKVMVSGPGSLLANLKEVSAGVDVSNADKNLVVASKVEALGADNQSIGSLRFEPKEVTALVSLARESLVKTVGIKLQTSGSLKPNLVIDQIILTPASVSISGETNLLRKTNYLETNPIALDKIITTSTISGRAVVPSGIELVDKDNTISVTIVVKEIEILKDMSLPIKIINLSSGYSVERTAPAFATIVVKGPQEALKSQNPGDAKLVIDGKDLIKGEQTVGLSLDQIQGLNQNIQAVLLTTNSIQVYIL